LLAVDSGAVFAQHWSHHFTKFRAALGEGDAP
jgi:hypothetical protein